MTIQAVIQHLKIVCLVQLVWLEMLISIGTNILDMELDLIDMDLTHTIVVGLEEM